MTLFGLSGQRSISQGYLVHRRHARDYFLSVVQVRDGTGLQAIYRWESGNSFWSLGFRQSSLYHALRVLRYLSYIALGQWPLSAHAIVPVVFRF
jgi:hypothetical protein